MEEDSFFPLSGVRAHLACPMQQSRLQTPQECLRKNASMDILIIHCLANLADQARPPRPLRK